MAATKLSSRQLNDVYNQAVASQTLAASDTYVTGSNMSLATIKAGTRVRWRIAITKTAAGVAQPIFNIRIGTAGTTADTARVTLTGLAQTAVIDTAFIEIEVVFRTVGSGTSAVIAAMYCLTHNLSITGFATLQANVLQGVSSGFNSTVANSVIGLSINGGTSSAWTIVECNGELINTN